jgi:V8-like Glu-specific endopeptidase
MNDAESYLELLSPEGGGRGELESTGGGSNRDPALRSELLERLEAEIAYTERATGIPADPNVREEVLALADDGVRRLLADGPDARLNADVRSGLEAVVRTNGSRPVLFVQDDFVDLNAPSIGNYGDSLRSIRDAVTDVCRSVGRVDDPTGSLGYQGTAWMIGEGLVATNYHVLKAIAPSGTRVGDRFEGRLTAGVAVHFGHEARNPLPERRFPIRRVVGVGRAGDQQHLVPGTRDLNFDGLDLAVLELEPVASRPFPPPLTVARGDDPETFGALASQGRGVYLVGYPGDGTTRELFVELFKGVKSFKRLAPGEIMQGPGTVEHDPRGWVITHDASTLGGNSGSALVDLDAAGRAVIGLHFAGHHERRNWAHATERITDVLTATLPSPVQAVAGGSP